jgi:hypothetical protein
MSETLKYQIATDIVMNILANLRDRKGFEVIEAMDRPVFMQMRKDLIDMVVRRLGA